MLYVDCISGNLEKKKSTFTERIIPKKQRFFANTVPNATRIIHRLNKCFRKWKAWPHHQGLFNKDPKVILIVGATPTLQGLI